MNSNEEVKTELDIPYGYCHCGCGGLTELATRTRNGFIKGRHVNFIKGHARLKCKHERTPANLYKNGSCKICAKTFQKIYGCVNAEKIKADKQKWYGENKDKVKTNYKNYYNVHKEEINKKHRLYRKNNPEKHRRFYVNNKNVIKLKNDKNTNNLSDSYVASLLNIPVSEVPPAMLEVKRLYVKIKRKLKELKNANNV